MTLTACFSILTQQPLCEISTRYAANSVTMSSYLSVLDATWGQKLVAVRMWSRTT